MNFEATYIEENANTLKKAGLILKGNTRNTRQPVHMMLLCDTSGSMEEHKKLASVQKSINLLLSLLSPDDRISLVTFADSSKIILSRVAPTNEDRQAIQYRVDNLNADGSTNLSSGLLEVRSLVESADSGRKQGVIILTDGHANVGVVKEEGLLDIIKHIQGEQPGLTFTCVAYGVDHNSELLTQVGKVGGGAYNVVKNLEDVATVFGDILGGLVSVSAQGVQIQLPPGAKAKTSYPCEKDQSGVTTIYVGDIYADSEVVILFENSPTMGPLRIKGTNMATLERIDSVVEPTAYQRGQNIPVAIHIAQFRQETADLIKLAMRDQSSIVEAKIKELITEIEIDDKIRDHPLKPMLLEDLESAKKIVQKRGAVSANETIELAQHSAFISMTRGIRSSTREPESAHRAPLQRSPNAFLSPFASRAQAQYATAMRTMSQRDDEDENSQENT